jgi:hypothetical protein
VTAERDRLREQISAAATVIGPLHADNVALRQQLDRQGTVIALDPISLSVGDSSVNASRKLTP